MDSTYKLNTEQTALDTPLFVMVWGGDDFTSFGELSVISANELLEQLDMEDCDALEGITAVYRLVDGLLRKVRLLGAWHDVNDPLFLEVVDEETGKVYASGYGTDH